MAAPSPGAASPIGIGVGIAVGIGGKTASRIVRVLPLVAT